jgi:thiamine-phosphate pyrophosphorylase
MPPRREQATRLLALCRAAGVPLVINDDLALALEIGADGVHLGRDDGDPAAARRPSARPHPRRQLLRRMAAGRGRRGGGCRLPGLRRRSPVAHQAPRAPRRPRPAARAKRELGLPVAAIGGITLDNAPPLIAPARLLAVISDVFSAPTRRPARPPTPGCSIDLSGSSA